MSSSSLDDDDVNVKLKSILRERLILQLPTLLTTSKVFVSTSSLLGSRFIQELLAGLSTLCYELMRIGKNCFISLCQMFREKGWLVDSKHLIVEEKMAMFFMTVSHNLRNRLVKNRFQHSGQTVHKYFHQVLDAMMKFSKEMITPPSFNDKLSGISNRRLKQVLKDVIGAIDRTLVHACIPSDKQVPYRSQGKWECFQNVMAICDFDMIFKYVVVGWEGTANDSRVLKETIHDSRHNFPMPPPDKYYLVDSTYTHTRGFMAPYRNARYLLNDFRSGSRANTKEEVFNQCHSRLRNIIEHAFGVLKSRFLILKRMSSYSFDVQRRIVLACFTLHNFLRKTSINDELFSQYDDEEVQL